MARLPRFHIEYTNENLSASSGLVLLGRMLEQDALIGKTLSASHNYKNGISDRDIVVSYLGLLCQGKNDYEALGRYQKDRFFRKSLGIKRLPSVVRLRQRIDANAASYSLAVKEANFDFLKRAKPEFGSLKSGHIPVDMDVFPQDNSETKKEGVTRTYAGYDGFAPIACYMGLHGYNLETELRIGKQHSHKGAPAFLRRNLLKASQLSASPLLARMDSGFDSAEMVNMLETLRSGELSGCLDYIIKWNPRQAIDTEDCIRLAQLNGEWKQLRDGKRINVFSVFREIEYENKRWTVRRVVRLIERRSKADGQILIVPEYDIAVWSTSLNLSEEEVIDYYKGLGTMEQFHSEFKTDLDMERLPSGKMASNTFIMNSASLAYNLLRCLGQTALLGPNTAIRHKAKRRRIKTVIQELITIACKLTKSGRRLVLKLCRNNPVSEIFSEVYMELISKA